MAKKRESTTIDKEIATELAMGSISIYRKLVAEAEKLDTLLVDVVSREGNHKTEVHAIVSAIAQMGEIVRKQLSELLVTPKSKKQGGRGGGGSVDADDPVNKLVERLSEIEDD